MRFSRIKNFNIRDYLVCLFICWPVFYSLWSEMRVTVNIFSGFPVLLLYLMVLLSVILFRKVYVNISFVWLLFYLVTLITIWKANRPVYIRDLSIGLSAWIICNTVGKRNVRIEIIVKWLIRIGVFVCLTVIIESVFGVFKGILKDIIYSERVLSMLQQRREQGNSGIFTYSSIAGCFIYPGFFAYVISKRIRNKRYWFTVLIFVLSMLLISKRGFIIDTLICFLFLFFIERKAKGKLNISLRKMKRIVSSIVLLIIIAIVLYTCIPLIRSAVNGLLYKFYNDDSTLSGRTYLYARALQLFKDNPVLGIGWGNFRGESLYVLSKYSAKTYETHNVYLQLLCENGIIGLLSFLSATISVLVYTCKRLLTSYRINAVSHRSEALRLSILLQMFFITYCMSGNPLYDNIFVITYYFGILMLGVNEEQAL